MKLHIYLLCVCVACGVRAPKKPKPKPLHRQVSVLLVFLLCSVEVLSAHYKFTGIQFIVAAIKKKVEEEAAEKVAKRSQNVVVSVGYQICRV